MTVQLPHKLSLLATIAIDDVVAVEQLPGFEINLGVWCSPGTAPGTPCVVCAAGSVMIRRLGHKGRRIGVGDFSALFGEDNARALMAIDCLRRGAVQSALDALEHGYRYYSHSRFDRDGHPLSRDMREASGIELTEDDDPEDWGGPATAAWVEAMQVLIADLTEAGL